MFMKHRICATVVLCSLLSVLSHLAQIWKFGVYSLSFTSVRDC